MANLKEIISVVLDVLCLEKNGVIPVGSCAVKRIASNRFALFTEGAFMRREVDAAGVEEFVLRMVGRKAGV